MKVEQFTILYILTCHLTGRLQGKSDSKPPTCGRGPTGQRGDRGTKGYDGTDGKSGEIGRRGDDWILGPTGKPGPKGRPGLPGLPGRDGLSGMLGEPGSPGLPGHCGFSNQQTQQNSPNTCRGPPGRKGDPGFLGIPGQKGDKGELGEPGRPGACKDPRLDGLQGIPGDPGPPGPPGFHGRNGFPGREGEKGLPGLPGQKGMCIIPSQSTKGRYPVCKHGQSGRRGDFNTSMSVIGFPGPIGEYGPRGHKGEKGATGPKGKVGPPGECKIPKLGLKVLKGRQGPRGPPGDDGSNGLDGLPGYPGLSGLPGFKGIDCLLGCNTFVHYDNITGRNFTIQDTVAGETFYTDDMCPVDKKPIGKIRCLHIKPREALWDEFHFNPHCDYSEVPKTAISESLRNLSQVEETDVLGILEVADNITKNVTLNELDLLYLTIIMEKTNNKAVQDERTIMEAMNIYSTVADSPEEVLIKAQERGYVANRVLETVDNITGKLIPKEDGYNRVVTDKIWTEVWNMQTSNLPIGLQLKSINFQHSTINDTLTVYNGTDLKESRAAIIFPGGVLPEIAKNLTGSSFYLSMTAYMDSRLFDISGSSTNDTNNFTLNSEVISAKIIIDGEAVTDIRYLNVTTIFLPHKKLPEKYRSEQTVCAYWDFTGNDNRGAWFTDGCHYVGVKNDRDVCLCDHLTNFAVLMEMDDRVDPTHLLSLSIITKSGLSLSISGLSITILTFIIFRTLRENQSQRTLFNLAVAELCAWIVFLVGFNQTHDTVGCIVAAALLHYFILASFMWMFAEAVLHYRLFVKVLGTYTSRYMLKTGIPAWSVPLLPVIAVLAKDVNPYRRENYCWLSMTAFYYAFALPVGLVILCNIIIYILVVINICKKSHGALSDEAKKKRRNVNLRASFLIFILFGVSWTFGFLAISDAKVVFQYIFCITSSTQGFLIFLLFTVQNKQVRDSWTGLCRKKKDVSSQGRKITESIH